MPAFYYYSTLEDWWGLLTSVVGSHAVRFAVGRPYEQEHVDYHSALDETIKSSIVSATRSVFLVGPHFSRDPLVLRRQPTGVNTGKFFIDELRGGPCLSIDMSGQFQERGLWWFAEGRLSAQNRYWSDALRAYYPCPSEVRGAFEGMAQTLRNHLKERSVGGDTLWLSPQVCDLFDSGHAGLPVGGKCFTIRGEVPPPTAWVYKKKERETTVAAL